MEKFTTEEFAKKLGCKKATLKDWRQSTHWHKKPRLLPAGYDGRFPYYTEEQLEIARKLLNSHRKKSSPPDTEPAAQINDAQADDSISVADTVTPVVVSPYEPDDAQKLIMEPLKEKKLEELTNEISSCIQRGDDCLAKSAMFYCAAGMRLLEIKSRLKHGLWLQWLRDWFPLSNDTAQNYMRLAKKFGTAKTELNRFFSPTTLLELTKLPDDKLEDFIAEQKQKGTPLEEQTTLEVKKNIRNFKRKHATKDKADSINDNNPAEQEIRGNYLDLLGNNKNTAVVNELNQTTTKDELITSTATDTPEQIIAIRELINQTNDLQTLQAIRDSLADLLTLVDSTISQREQKK